MPAVSKAQRRYMAICEHSDREDCPDMSKKQYRDFSRTKEKNLPHRKSKRRKRRLSR